MLIVLFGALLQMQHLLDKMNSVVEIVTVGFKSEQMGLEEKKKQVPAS